MLNEFYLGRPCGRCKPTQFCVNGVCLPKEFARTDDDDFRKPVGRDDDPFRNPFDPFGKIPK